MKAFAGAASSAARYRHQRCWRSACASRHDSNRNPTAAGSMISCPVRLSDSCYERVPSSATQQTFSTRRQSKSRNRKMRPMATAGITRSSAQARWVGGSLTVPSSQNRHFEDRHRPGAQPCAVVARYVYRIRASSAASRRSHLSSTHPFNVNELPAQVW